MRIAPWLMTGLALLLCASAGAQGAKPTPKAKFDFEQWKRDEKMKARVLARAYEIRPGRRDTPMRDLNITDDEVREVQVVAEKLLPRALVNISTVVTGCPCEDGPQCTDQVYVLANRSQTTLGLQLSRIKNAWTLGTVQQWWLEYDALLSRQPTMESQAFRDAETELVRKFPVCVGELVPATQTASRSKPEAKK